MGRRVSSKPVSLVSDAADEFESAAKILGWIPTPSLPNRFPHNSQHELKFGVSKRVCDLPFWKRVLQSVQNYGQ